MSFGVEQPEPLLQLGYIRLILIHCMSDGTTRTHRDASLERLAAPSFPT